MQTQQNQRPPHPAAYATATAAEPAPEPPSWLDRYDERAQLQIFVCRLYDAKYADSGMPGHTLMRLVAWLAQDIDNILANEAQSAPTSPTAPSPQEQPAAQPEPRRSTITMHNPAGPATQKQLSAIYAFARTAHYAEATLDDLVAERYGVQSSDLSKAEASELIDWLKSQGGRA